MDPIITSQTSQEVQKKKSLKATWSQALLIFFTPFVIGFAFRWIMLEPYVIPSGSMIPTLMIHDHIVVNKWTYGLRVPFSEKWLYYWRKPLPGEIVVFKYPRSIDTYFVKRVVAIEGDEVSVVNGQLIRNGQPVTRVPISDTDLKSIKSLSRDELSDEFDYFHEDIGEAHFVSRSFKTQRMADFNNVKVPAGHFFVVGDNRDESSDSRVWGFVPYENLMGKAWLIWLSCTETLPANPMLCNPGTIRWTRLFKNVMEKY